MAETKVGYGRASNIESAIASGKIDKGDIVITSDTNEFVFIAPDGALIRCRSQISKFDALDDAVTYAEESPAAYDGEIINIYSEEHGAFLPYTLTQGSDGKLKVCNPNAGIQETFIWKEI